MTEFIEPVRRKLPGRPRSKRAIIAEQQKGWADLAAQSDRHAAYAALFAPKPERMHYWRVQLDCGCVRDKFTRDADEMPWRRGDEDPIHDRELDPGVFVCCERPGKSLYRPVATWDKRKMIEHPAEPVEPPDYWCADAESWTRRRRTEPYITAFWTVTLECGHPAHAVTDPDWVPEHGPVYPTPERLAAMRAEEWFANNVLGDDPHDVHGHFARELEAGWPRPFHEYQCWACPRARRAMAYEYHGVLANP